MAEDNLDDILESALEDFEKVDQQTTVNTSQTQTTDNASNNNQTPPLANQELLNEVNRLMENLSVGNDLDFNKLLDDLINPSGSGNQQGTDLLSGLDTDKLLEQPEMGEFLQDMVSKLISKDIMYQPLKEMQAKYPEWLAANKDKLSTEEFQKYTKQYEVVTTICTVFETKPDDMQTVIELMQQMHETGHPPVDIIKAITPDADLDDSALKSLLGGSQNCNIM